MYKLDEIAIKKVYQIDVSGNQIGVTLLCYAYRGRDGRGQPVPH